MFLPLGLVVILALTTSLANGQETEYKIIEMKDVKAFKETPCPADCNDPMNEGFDVISNLLKGALKTVKFPVEFCQQCQLTGLANFTHKIDCFMSPEKNVFDHGFTVTFPNLGGNCQCNLSTTPSEAATQINKGKLIEGSCGEEKLKNTYTCTSIQCEGRDGSGNESVSLAVDLKGSKIVGVLRVDNRTQEAFPIELTLITPKPAEITHEASEKFGESWNCLNGDKDAFNCHLFANAPAPFFECLTPEDDANAINGILFLFGNCKIKE